MMLSIFSNTVEILFQIPSWQMKTEIRFSKEVCEILEHHSLNQPTQ